MSGRYGRHIFHPVNIIYAAYHQYILCVPYIHYSYLILILLCYQDQGEEEVEEEVDLEEGMNMVEDKVQFYVLFCLL